MVAVEKSAIRIHDDLATPSDRPLWGPHIHHGLKAEEAAARPVPFLGLVRFVPVVPLDRLVPIICWTAYIDVGGVLEDRRLAHLPGGRYREYQARVPGYATIPSGPLARVPLAALGHPENPPRALSVDPARS
jgi:hypothetical protein